MPTKKFDEIASDELINKAKEALEKNGIQVFVLESGEDAKKKALEIIPEGAEVMNMTSVTLSAIGLDKEILESGKYDSVRNKLNSMDRKTQGSEMQKMGAAPLWAIGSVHSVTEDGKVLIASNTGSQLPAYAYGSTNVVWVVGSQKLVKDLEEGMKRIYEYVLPLESERAKKAYGAKGSFVSKVLIINKEIAPDRIKMLIVKEKLGF